MIIGRSKVVTGPMAGLISLAAIEVGLAQSPAGHEQQVEMVDGPLARSVRKATAPFQDVQAAVSAGYALSGGCVSGPEHGAMGVHFVNASLVGDGVLDPALPEALVYEPRNGGLQLGFQSANVTVSVLLPCPDVQLIVGRESGAVGCRHIVEVLAVQDWRMGVIRSTVPRGRGIPRPLGIAVHPFARLSCRCSSSSRDSRVGLFRTRPRAPSREPCVFRPCFLCQTAPLADGQQVGRSDDRYRRPGRLRPRRHSRRVVPGHRNLHAHQGRTRRWTVSRHSRR